MDPLILGHLALHPDSNVADIADGTGLDPADIQTALDRLVADRTVLEGKRRDSGRIVTYRLHPASSRGAAADALAHAFDRADQGAGVAGTPDWDDEATDLPRP